jgi:hypothetical protein
MDGSSQIFVVLPIVIPLALFTGVALPFLADSHATVRHRVRGAVKDRVDARPPDQGLPGAGGTGRRS